MAPASIQLSRAVPALASNPLCPHHEVSPHIVEDIRTHAVSAFFMTFTSFTASRERLPARITKAAKDPTLRPCRILLTLVDVETPTGLTTLSYAAEDAGLSLVCAFSMNEVAEYMIAMANKADPATALTDPALLRLLRENTASSAHYTAIFEAVGVPKGAAESMKQHFGTLSSLASASTDELRTLRDVGPTIAEKWKQLMDAPI